jgi:PAS domain-containing protein
MKKRSREDKGTSEGEREEIRSSVLPTATGVLQVQLRAEQEIRHANDVLGERTRQLAHVLAIMRATLESTSDAILVTDEKNEVVDFNDNYLDIWRIPRQVLRGGTLLDVRELASRSFTDPKAFLARIAEIAVGGQESFDLLELKGRAHFRTFVESLVSRGPLQGPRVELARRDAALSLGNNVRSACGHRRIIRRRHHRKGPKQYHHQLECRRGAHLRIHRRRNDRHFNHAFDPDRSPCGGTGDPRPYPAQRTC